MNNKNYQSLFTSYLLAIGSKTMETYHMNYNSCYGGWRLETMDKDGCYNGQGQFDNYLRMSSKEMLKYLEGILKGLTARRYTLIGNPKIEVK